MERRSDQVEHGSMRNNGVVMSVQTYSLPTTHDTQAGYKAYQKPQQQERNVSKEASLPDTAAHRQAQSVKPDTPTVTYTERKKFEASPTLGYLP